ncbi:TPA: hypothetical protein P5S08_004620 [Salmonella enterica subsp. enterica serovar Concord]|nr:hypothetical protein [Salmonella enterica subsp. enterica serovar Concord]
MDPHQIVGEVVHQMVKENAPIDFYSIQQRMVDEFIRVSKPGCDMEKAQTYEAAMEMFAVDYKPEIY